MKGKEVTVRISKIVFAQLMFLGCAGTFGTEFTKKAEINVELELLSLVVVLTSAGYLYFEYTKIFKKIKTKR